MKDAWIAVKKTKNTGIKCPSMDIQKANCKVGMLKWKHSETVLNTVNHVNYVNRYIQVS